VSRGSSASSPTATIADLDQIYEQVLKDWRRRRLSASTIRGYRVWIARHRADCAAAGIDEIAALTRKHLAGFARRCATKLGLTESRVFVPAQSALRAWSAALSAMGFGTPQWTPPPPPSPFAEVVRYWREHGYRPAVIQQYLTWLKRHHAQYQGVRPDLLTRRDSLRFARYHVRRHELAESAISTAHSALHAWSAALAALGVSVPPWRPPRRPDDFAAILTEYQDFRRRLRGVRASSLELECRHARALLRWLRRRRRPLSSITIRDVDRFLLDVGARVSLVTLGSACTSVRGFLRFLHAGGHLAADLARDVQGPRVSRTANPPQGLTWPEVRKILSAVDRSTLIGKRDYAALLLMASYGMGSGEVRGLRLDDIDWRAGTLHVVRKKTGVTTILPLLGPVGDALASYLRAGPPRPPSVRTILLRAVAPPAPLSPMQLRRRFHLHARKAGVSAAVNTHAFRHSHATRQVESAAPPRVVSEILGHADTSSLSTYARVAVEKLRTVCLPVP
jgi:integrase/recombinase XerD